MIFETRSMEFLPTAGTSWSMPASLEIFRKISELAQLPAGWHYGAGKVVPKRVVETACELAETAIKYQLNDIDVFPGKDGQLTIAIYFADANHSFQIQPDGQVCYWDEANADGEEEELTRTAALNKIGDIAWNLSFTSTFAYGTRGSSISEVKHLNLQATEAESPWSMQSVFDATLVPFVTTRASFTLPLVRSPRSSGDSILPVSRLEVA